MAAAKPRASGWFAGNRDAGDFDVGQRPPGDDLNRALVPQPLLDGRFGQTGVGHERLPLFGVAEQVVHGVADEIGRGLVGGVDHADDVAEQLGLAQLLALLFGGDHAAQQVVARLGANLGKQRRQVFAELHGRGGAPGGPAALSGTALTPMNE